MSTVVPLIDDANSTSETADVIPASDSAAPATLEEPEAAVIPAPPPEEPAPAPAQGGRRHRKSRRKSFHRKSHPRKSRKSRRSKSRHHKSRRH